jgi:hypothetical protein
MSKFVSLSKYTHPFDQQAMTMNPPPKKTQEKKNIERGLSWWKEKTKHNPKINK